MGNRIIKFRAWDSVSKIMYYQESLTGGAFADYDISVIIGFDNHAYLLREDEHGNKIIDDNAGSLIPMQYCGLKDKNGKEIYESDIDQDGGRIFYNESIAAFQIDYGGDVDIADMEDVDKWMVVSGNIYESPELLNPLNKQS